VAASIGIKIANGEFYPIIDEDSQTTKRLVLTTVHDDQRSTQIDLYRSETSSMTDAQPVGSLVVENIKSRKKGEPSVEFLISLDADGEISAEAKDLDNPAGGENSQLSVSLKTLRQNALDSFPDFDIEPQDDLSGEDTGKTLPATRTWRHPKKIVPVLPLVALIVVILAALFLVWFFVLGGKIPFGGGNKVPAGQALVTETPPPPPVVQPPPPIIEVAPPSPPPPVTPPPPPPVTPPPLVTAKTPPAPAKTSASRARPVPPVRSYKVPATIPKGGVKYKIRWGDTLWDISQAFYRNPNRYAYLARWNGIKNPNRIISGKTIIIPPR
jgi:LysM repeat protein